MSTRSGRHFRVEKEPSEATGKETDRSKTMDHDSSTRQHRDSANVDTKSVKSKSTKSSSIYGSSTSSAAMKARAKVESARALLAYANKEAELLRQKAALDADMLICKVKSDQAASRNPIITQTRANYRQETEDLAKYLIRKDLVSSRLIIFDEKPENYRAWKASFRDVIRDLNLLPREELDLLIKWLGGKSSLHAKRLRSAQVTNPQVGLDMVWQRLDECYGAPEVVEQALLRKVDDFPKMNTKDNTKIRELGDVLLELECAMRDGTLPGLSYLDSAGGVKRIVEKLPPGLQDKWRSKGARYKEDYNVTFPPFSVFSRFVRQEAKILNDPSFEVNSSAGRFAYPERVKTHITGMIESSPASGQCPIHKKPHPLLKCRAFLSMPLEERKACLMENRLCFRCMATSDHVARNCKVSVKCAECGSVRHNTALHVDQAFFRDTQVTKGDNGGEQNSSSVTSKCTEICGDNLGGRSCSKVCQVKVYTQRKEHEAIKVYAVLDEQSNRSLAKPQLFDALGITSTTTPYTLRTCSGIMETAGRRANNLMISSIDDKVKFHLPALIECEMIPDDRQEIPTPDIANHFSHLKHIANKIPPVDPQVQILLLLGRDVLRAHKVREHINGPHDAPYAQRLDLGWVIVGEVCLGTSHQPKHHNVFKTSVYSNGRTSLMEPCSNMIQVKERIDKSQKSGLNITSNKGSTGKVQFGTAVFDKTNEDEKEALSIEDNIFLDIMDRHVHQDENGSWVAPLPFRPERRRLPNNRIQAQKRLYSLRKSLEKDSTKKNQFAEFVQKMLDNDHAEPAPIRTWERMFGYLPYSGCITHKSLTRFVSCLIPQQNLMTFR
ncbi:hypothetical protein BSL78_14928 [Apostichopus japonicus]|uniref:Peptidase aspartic putative domain-containing protein n=1 Tax=Stichopus japonicus TaxID=307972 RepID=A0A2G8KJP0_STIJA|nr:hypothetical protein BSL78_14928 [Apostichopus japonicus]